jgi:hypothetical protein
LPPDVRYFTKPGCRSSGPASSATDAVTAIARCGKQLRRGVEDFDPPGGQRANNPNAATRPAEADAAAGRNLRLDRRATMDGRRM